MQNSKPKYPPSKALYLKKNPVVSFHLPAEDLKKLREMASRDDVKISDYFRNVAQGLIVGDDNLQRSRRAGYDEGYDEGLRAGYKNARKEYRIALPCCDCGRPAILRPGTPAHDELSRNFSLNGWLCKICYEKRVMTESPTDQE